MPKSVFRYPGGKSRAFKKILQYFPTHFSEFREPFVGGGSIFFAVDAAVPKRWINDCHADLIAVYIALRDFPDEFIALCKGILPMQPGEETIATKDTGKKYNKRLNEKFQELLNDCQSGLLQRALRYLFINRTNWAGRVNFKLPSRMYFSNPQGWNIVKTERLERAAEHLWGTTITCEDFSLSFTAPGEDVLIYADPPYVVNTEMPETDKQYQNNFTLEDHHRLSWEAQRCKHRLCISYDDHELVRQLYCSPRFKIHSESWTYSGSAMSKKPQGKEVIITNY